MRSRVARGSPWRAGWRELVAGFLLAFVALLPVADVFCAIGLPQTDAPTLVSSLDAPPPSATEGGQLAPCWEQAPSVRSAPHCETDTPVAANSRSPERSPASVSRASHPSFSPFARQTIRIDLPPAPEPRFRRLKRLLI